MPVQLLSYLAPIRIPSWNAETRAARIDRLQGRLDRLRRCAEQITTELAAVTQDVESLSIPGAASLEPRADQGIQRASFLREWFRKEKRQLIGAAGRGGESRDDRERLGMMPDAIGDTNGNNMKNTLMRSAPCPHCGAQTVWTQNASHAGSGEAASAAYRCVNGHVLDSSTTRQCPTCGVHDTTLLGSADGRQDFRCARCGQAFTFPREVG
jgi:endogenous inhibitor of DNA gyrase (YacG/DUF329 family)